MLIKPVLAKCGDRTILPKMAAANASPEEWFCNTFLVTKGLFGLSFDFFINWSTNAVTPVIWVKRIIHPNTAYSEIISDISNILEKEFTLDYLIRLHDFSKKNGLTPQLILFHDNQNWNDNQSKIIIVDIYKANNALQFNPAITTINNFQQKIKVYSGGPVSIGSKGLFYGTSSLECFLSKTNSLYPGDVDMLLLDADNNVLAMLEYKKHNLPSPITEERLSKYYPAKDARKYNRLAILKDYLSVFKKEEIPMLNVYYPTSMDKTHGRLELLQGNVNNLSSRAFRKFAIPTSNSHEVFTAVLNDLLAGIKFHASNIKKITTVKKLPVEQDLIKLIDTYLLTNNLGSRGVEDGNKRKQQVGLIGELIVHKYLLGAYPDLNEKPDGFDGGFDMEYNGKRIDVKTMERKSYVRPNFVNNFYLLQQAHHADVIVFCSYHAVDNILEICGWVPKNELQTRGIYYAAGTKRIRTDGSSFIFRQNNYEIENKDLMNIDGLKEGL